MARSPFTAGIRPRLGTETVDRFVPRFFIQGYFTFLPPYRRPRQWEKKKKAKRESRRTDGRTGPHALRLRVSFPLRDRRFRPRRPRRVSSVAIRAGGEGAVGANIPASLSIATSTGRILSDERRVVTGTMALPRLERKKKPKQRNGNPVHREREREMEATNPAGRPRGWLDKLMGPETTVLYRERPCSVPLHIRNAVSS